MPVETFLRYIYPKCFLLSSPNASRVFNNSAPSLSQFGLTGLNFGLFDEATIETKNIINNSYLNNHSGNINLNID